MAGFQRRVRRNRKKQVSFYWPSSFAANEVGRCMEAGRHARAEIFQAHGNAEGRIKPQPALCGQYHKRE